MLCILVNFGYENSEMGQVSDMQTVAPGAGTLSILTEKQREVLDLVLMHKSSKEIARTLQISPYTVDQRITAARQKLGSATRGDLARSYSRLKSLCGETAYDFPYVETEAFSLQQLSRDQLADPVFKLSDAAFVKMDAPWHDYPVSPVGLEAFDNRFGILGRVIVIPTLAAFMALLVLSMLAIGETLTRFL